MKEYKTLADLAKEYGFPVANTEAALKEYNENAQKQAKDAANGPYEAYGGGSSISPLSMLIRLPLPQSFCPRGRKLRP